MTTGQGDNPEMEIADVIQEALGLVGLGEPSGPSPTARDPLPTDPEDLHKQGWDGAVDMCIDIVEQHISMHISSRALRDRLIADMEKLRRG